MNIKKLSGQNDRRHFRFEQLEPRLVLDASALVISEFMASNDNTLLDADGDDSDWIEIFNPSAEAIDLTGLHLTDDAEQLDRWQFQAGTAIDPGGFLLVFASGKDTVLNSFEQHTDFKLSAGGEYLALVDADGSTIIDQFSPEFPAQQEDISYGPEMQSTGVQTVRLAEGDNAKGLIPSNGNLGLDWTEADFDDTSWPISGPTGFGYENNPGEPTNYNAEIQTSITPGTQSYYMRVPFALASLEDLGSLTLKMRYDDGFVAYINGHRFASANAPDNLQYNSPSVGGQSDTDSEQFEEFDANSAIRHLRVGNNVLAIHALNLPNSSDALHAPELVSTGSQLVAPADIGFFVEPTPGYGNLGETITGFAESPEFSVPHGFYDNTQNVALSSPTQNATIVYTTDGSTPELDENLNLVNGQIYTSALTISATTTLRAVAYRQDYEPSPLVASTYLFVDDIIQQSPNGQVPGPGWAADGVNGKDLNYGIDPQIVSFYGAEAVKDSLKSLSVFSITTDLDNLFDSSDGIYVNAENRGRDWERPASVELIDDEGGFLVNAGLRIRGGFSRNDFNPKNGFRFYFRQDYGASKLEYPLFGEDAADKFDVLDLRTAQNYSWSSSGDPENTFVREVFGRDLQRDLGQPYTRSRYHHLYLNGVYWGIYQTQERIEKYYGETYLGGEEEDYDVVKSDLAVSGGTEVADGNDLAWRQLFDLAQDLADNPAGNANNYWTMQGLNPDGTSNESLPILLDVDNLVDYMIDLFYTGGFDTGISLFLGNDKANNWFGVRNRVTNEHGFQFFIHDNEHSLGTNDTDTIDRTGPFNEGNQSNFSQFNPHYLHQDLLASPEYRLAFADRVQKHFFNEGPLTADASLARMLTRAAEVEPAIIAESARWGDSKVNSPLHKTHWQNEINTLNANYFNLRRNLLILNQLPGDGLFPSVQAATFSQFGGQIGPGFSLGISAPAGTIYYTLDGTDPRAIGGAVSGDANLYSSSVDIASTLTVKSRVLHNGIWSPLTEAKFILPVPGDFNLDGNINDTDLAIWTDDYGATSGSLADADEDDDTDGSDFLAWQRAFTAAPQSLAAVASESAPSAVETTQASTTSPIEQQEDEALAQQSAIAFATLSNSLTTLETKQPFHRQNAHSEAEQETVRQQAFAETTYYTSPNLLGYSVAAELASEQSHRESQLDTSWDQLAESLLGNS